jgi:hypothetical protein
MTLSIMALYIECCYAECRNFLNVKLSVVMLSVVVPFKSTANKKISKYFETLRNSFCSKVMTVFYLAQAFSMSMYLIQRTVFTYFRLMRDKESLLTFFVKKIHFNSSETTQLSGHTKTRC